MKDLQVELRVRKFLAEVATRNEIGDHPFSKATLEITVWPGPYRYTFFHKEEVEPPIFAVEETWKS